MISKFSGIVNKRERKSSRMYVMVFNANFDTCRAWPAINRFKTYFKWRLKSSKVDSKLTYTIRLWNKAHFEHFDSLKLFSIRSIHLMKYFLKNKRLWVNLTATFKNNSQLNNLVIFFQVRIFYLFSFFLNYTRSYTTHVWLYVSCSRTCSSIYIRLPRVCSLSTMESLHQFRDNGSKPR